MRCASPDRYNLDMRFVGPFLDPYAWLRDVALASVMAWFFEWRRSQRNIVAPPPVEQRHVVAADHGYGSDSATVTVKLTPSGFG
jgi:hypothetical protein